MITEIVMASAASTFISHIVSVLAAIVRAPFRNSVLYSRGETKLSIQSSLGQVLDVKGITSEQLSALVEALQKHGSTVVDTKKLKADSTKAAAQPKAARPASPAVVIGWPYKVALIFVCFVTIASIAGQAILAERWNAPTPTQGTLMENLGFAWKMGFGAIVGLIGGKAAK